MQFPGPISLLVKPDVLLISFIIVILDIPPIFKIHMGNLNFNFFAINWWKIGVSGAPSPLLYKCGPPPYWPCSPGLLLMFLFSPSPGQRNQTHLLETPCSALPDNGVARSWASQSKSLRLAASKVMHCAASMCSETWRNTCIIPMSDYWDASDWNSGHVCCMLQECIHHVCSACAQCASTLV